MRIELSCFMQVCLWPFANTPRACMFMYTELGLELFASGSVLRLSFCYTKATGSCRGTQL